jgi:hypothetical protein
MKTATCFVAHDAGDMKLRITSPTGRTIVVPVEKLATVWKSGTAKETAASMKLRSLRTDICCALLEQSPPGSKNLAGSLSLTYAEMATLKELAA